jgi:hypothetical protein
MDIEMLQNTVLALLNAAPGLGSIHINKGLLLIDAYHHSLYQKTLTGINYVKHDLGPVPEPKAHDVLYRMELDQDQIEVRPEKKGPIHTLNAHYAVSKPNYNLFSKTAIDIIKEVAGMIRHMSATHLSKVTHNKIWEETPKGQVIPIESAYSSRIISRNVRKLTGQEREQAKNILEGFYGPKTMGLSAAN